MKFRRKKTPAPKNTPRSFFAEPKKQTREEKTPTKLPPPSQSPPIGGWIVILGLTVAVGAFWLLLSPQNFPLFLSSHYVYFGWLIFLGLFFSAPVFYLGSAALLFLYLAAVYLFRFSPPGSLLSFGKQVFLPVVEMAGFWGLLFLYRRRNRKKMEAKAAQEDLQEKKIEQLKQALQKEQVKSGNLERNFRNQEYTFSLVYRLFKSFLSSSRPFPQVLADSLVRITKAQKWTLFSVEENVLVSIESNSEAGAKKIPLKDDPFLQMVCRLGRLLTMPEIARSSKLYHMWKQSQHRGLLYLPVFQNKRLRYLVSIDKMPFYLFHNHTIQMVNSVLQMAEFSQDFLEQQKQSQKSPQPLWQQELQSAQNFLNTLQHEFRRARRFQSSFSLIGIHIRLHQDFKGNDVQEALSHYIRAEIRELDQFYFDRPRQIMWVILPFTGFPEMSVVLNRIDEKLSRLDERPFSEASFDYGFSIFEAEMDSPKVMLKQVVEIMQIHNKILQKISRRHAFV